MSGPGVAALLLEVSAGGLLSAIGIGGPVAIAALAMAVLLTAAYLLLRRRPPSPVKTLRAYLAKRRAIASPEATDDEAQEHDLDTLQGYWDLHAVRVDAFVRWLRRKGIIGANEERRMRNPRSVADLEWLVDRLATCEAQVR